MEFTAGLNLWLLFLPCLVTISMTLHLLASVMPDVNGRSRVFKTSVLLFNTICKEFWIELNQALYPLLRPLKLMLFLFACKVPLTRAIGIDDWSISIRCNLATLGGIQPHGPRGRVDDRRRAAPCCPCSCSWQMWLLYETWRESSVFTYRFYGKLL